MLLFPFGRMWYDQGKNIERERNMDKYVIFDIDGTLNQTALYAVEAYQTALAKRGREVSAQEVISCIGSSPEVIIHTEIENFGGGLFVAAPTVSTPTCDDIIRSKTAP